MALLVFKGDQWLEPNYQIEGVGQKRHVQISLGFLLQFLPNLYLGFKFRLFHIVYRNVTMNIAAVKITKL